MWQRRLKLGTYFRISVYVHWSFAFLVAYAGYAGLQDGPIGAAFAITVLFGMFVCVTLHEYGHALTARRFGIETLDITLFPIGGVARLMKIPRIPWQELLVAVAGPAVNVAIIVLLGSLVFWVPGLEIAWPARLLSDDQALEQFIEATNQPSWIGYWFLMLLVNTALIVFNMIPAFPMDGGRVLRSILAMGFEYRRATRIASNIGLVCAALMALAAFYFEIPTPGLIAIFICYAGLSEARQVDTIEPLRYLTVADVMIHSPPRVSMDHPVSDLLPQLRYCATTALPVVGPEEIVVGMLTLSQLTAAVQKDASLVNHAEGRTAGELARHDLPILTSEESLESVLTSGLGRNRQFAVADAEGRLIGLLDLDSLRSRAELGRTEKIAFSQTAAPHRPSENALR